MLPVDRPIIIHSSAPTPLRDHLSPLELWRLMVRHADLIGQFARREVLERHHGAALGVAWNIINPGLQLAVYTFVFSAVLGVDWPADVQGSAGKAAPFALILFCGQIVFHIFAESVNRAPVLITGRRNFVRKVVFPLEVLPISAVASTLLYLAIGVALVVIAMLATTGRISSTIWLFPLILVPLYSLCMGLSFLLSSLGVFLTDIRQIVTVATGLLIFCSGVFYPIDRVPEGLRPLVEYNPLHILIESARRTLLWSRQPDWPALGLVTIGSLIVLQVGYAWFAKSKRGMADVI